MEQKVCSKIYLQGEVLKMHVLYFRERRDGSPHEGIIQKKKKKKFINVRLIFCDKPKLLEQIYYFG